MAKCINKILIDSREPNLVREIAKRMNMIFEVKTLPIGDFVCEEKSVVVERKTIDDYISSVKSGHLYKQLLQMQENFETCILIISGDLAGSYAYDNGYWSESQHLGSLVSIIIRFPHIKLLQVSGDFQVLQVVDKVVSKAQDGKIISIDNTSLLKTKVGLETIKIRILCCFDRVGVKTAEKLLERQKISDAVNNLVDLVKNR